MDDSIFIFLIAGVLSFLGWQIKPENLEKVNKIHGIGFPSDKNPKDLTSEDLLKHNLEVDSVKKLKYKKKRDDTYLFANPRTNKMQVQRLGLEEQKIKSAWNPVNKNYEDPWPDEDINQTRRERKTVNKKYRRKFEKDQNLQDIRSSSEEVKNSMLKKLNLDYRDWEDVD